MDSPPISPISSLAAWTAGDLPPDAGLIRLESDCLDEVSRLTRELTANPLPIEALDPDSFDLPHCRAVMADALAALDSGVGFAIIDRLSIDEMATETARKVYWLLISMLGPPVAQKWNGEMVYDVTDTGLKEEAGNGVRSSKTNQGQYYHTDNSFNLPPEFVALLCLRPAKEGGASGLVSFQTAYNSLLDEQPDLVRRYFQPFYFDRQHEHPPDDERLSFKPVFTPGDGGVDVCFSRRLIEYGYQLSDEDMDTESETAVSALCEILERPELNISFEFQPGQIQIVNNRRLGHRRTAYADWPDPDRRRHLVRLWVRRRGRPFYLG